VRVLLFIVLALLIPITLAGQSKLVWSDEFDLPRGAPPDPQKWTHDIGGGGWGNRELQVYTSETGNASHDGTGHLAIRVLKDSEGVHTSARLKTLRKFEWEYGKVEGRIRVPFGQGIWPALWMLGNDFPISGWPKAGEIDVMEHIGKEPSTVHGTVHGPGYSGKDGISTQTDLAGNQRFSDDFHVFAVIWSPDSIEFFVDDRSYGRVTPGNLPRGTQWVFDHPFFLLLNVAVGGEWPGYPDTTTVFPQEMLVDWIRVWQLSSKDAK